MTSPAFQHDVGAFLTVATAMSPSVIVGTGATNTEEGVQQNGFIIDRGIGAGSNLALSAKFAMPYSAVLATGETAALLMNLQDSATTATGDFVDYNDKDGSTGQSVTVTTGAVSVLNNVLSADFDLASAKRYVRVQTTVTITSTAAADILDVAGVLVLGGYGSLPGS